MALLSAFAGLIAPALAILGGEYALSLGSDIDGRAPLFAGLLLLIGELAFWSLEHRRRIPTESGTLWLRGVAVGLGVGAAVVLAATMLALTAVPALPGGVAWELVGLLAAGTALALVVLLARPRAA